MKTIQYRTIDKSAWGLGPWQDEPDKIQWQDKATGLPCLAVRHDTMGHWCGYVGVPPEHPAHGKGYDDVEVNAHGGLTFSDKCFGTPEHGVCHIPDEGEPEHVWWLGFDCAHSGDLSPVMAARHPDLALYAGSHYRTLDYVRHECRELARQLAK